MKDRETKVQGVKQLAQLVSGGARIQPKPSNSWHSLKKAWAERERNTVFRTHKWSWQVVRDAVEYKAKGAGTVRQVWAGKQGLPSARKWPDTLTQSFCQLVPSTLPYMPPLFPASPLLECPFYPISLSTLCSAQENPLCLHYIHFPWAPISLMGFMTHLNT